MIISAGPVGGADACRREQTGGAETIEGGRFGMVRIRDPGSKPARERGGGCRRDGNHQGIGLGRCGARFKATGAHLLRFDGEHHHFGALDAAALSAAVLTP